MSIEQQSIAATRPINPPGEDLLTLEQVWKALRYKGRNPMRFVKPILSSEISNDQDTKVSSGLFYDGVNFNRNSQYTRTSKTTDMGGGMIEEITEYEPTMVYFDGNKGVRVTNLVSYDAQGDLQLTFSFVGGNFDLLPQIIKI